VALAAEKKPETSAAVELGLGALLDTVEELRRQLGDAVSELRELRGEVAELRGELRDRPTAEPDRDLVAIQSTPLPEAFAAPIASGAQTSDLEVSEQVSRLVEEQELQQRMLETLYQSKVESGSRYRVRLTGLALFNGFVTSDGGGENFDVPELAEPLNPLHSGRSFGTTMRQSFLGLDVSGPEFAGARTNGEFYFDFFGGFPETGNGVTAGLARLRTAALRLEWSNTTLTFGQTELFVSPLSPTSLASVAVPALSYSGNLWGWVPQVSVEHRFATSGGGTISVTGGMLDPLTGDDPVDATYFAPGAGHRGSMPALAGRLGWASEASDRPVVFGIGGYYARQDWGRDRIVNGWVTTGDWMVPLGRRVTLSGEFYSGRAFGGLGSGENGSVLFDGDPGLTSTSVIGLRSTGGWLQGSFALTNRIEFNSAVGQDSPSGADLERFRLSPTGGESPIGRNRTGFVNVILRARSNLLFSTEFRSVWTSRPDGTRRRIQHLNFAAGVTF